jgi:hypothetical protein
MDKVLVKFGGIFQVKPFSKIYVTKSLTRLPSSTYFNTYINKSNYYIMEKRQDKNN